MSLTAYELGEKSGRSFRESVESQLEAIAAKLGVRIADLGGSTSEYSSGPAYHYSGTGRSCFGARVLGVRVSDRQLAVNLLLRRHS
jgi:hypothetical protein